MAARQRRGRRGEVRAVAARQRRGHCRHVDTQTRAQAGVGRCIWPTSPAVCSRPRGLRPRWRHRRRVSRRRRTAVASSSRLRGDSVGVLPRGDGERLRVAFAPCLDFRPIRPRFTVSSSASHHRRRHYRRRAPPRRTMERLDRQRRSRRSWRRTKRERRIGKPLCRVPLNILYAVNGFSNGPNEGAIGFGTGASTTPPQVLRTYQVHGTCSRP